MSNIDWGRLVAQGRAKAHGIGWNEEEQKARYVHNIPADFVRKGVLTPEAYAKASVDQVKLDVKGESRAYSEKLNNAKEKARSLGVQFSEGVTMEVLEKEIAIKEKADNEHLDDPDEHFNIPSEFQEVSYKDLVVMAEEKGFKKKGKGLASRLDIIKFLTNI